MGKEKRQQELDESKGKEQKQEKEEAYETEQEDERNGVIPADIDFKKFLGCGG